MTKYLVGVDEAGRGPLAGPVSVGVAVVPFGFDWGSLPGVADSKQLSEEKREAVFKEAAYLQKQSALEFRVAMVSAQIIDRIGITKAVSLAMGRALERLDIDPAVCQVKLDGSLKAPAIFTDQETIIKGDSLEAIIGLASVMAKVTRDRYMTRQAERSEYAVYDFSVHKGYGTKKHRFAITKHGISNLHRQSYCGKLLS